MSFKATQVVVDAMRAASYFKIEIACLLLVARRADNKTYKVRVSSIRLAYELQRSPSSVGRYMAAWRTRGVLKTLVRGGNNRPTLYEIDLDAIKLWAEQHSLRSERRYQLEMIDDCSLTLQKPAHHQPQRNERQSDNRSFRSNELADHRRRRSDSLTSRKGEPQKIGDLLAETKLGRLVTTNSDDEQNEDD